MINLIKYDFILRLMLSIFKFINYCIKEFYLAELVLLNEFELDLDLWMLMNYDIFYFILQNW